jgi:hypothetical protein
MLMGEPQVRLDTRSIHLIKLIYVYINYYVITPREFKHDITEWLPDNPSVRTTSPDSPPLP